ncbi:MAG: hypothetical protein JNL90_15215 [Planctomycetes bacterium]|nr:hypothetical protein [Planctomycetota bacterium]
MTPMPLAAAVALLLVPFAAPLVAQTGGDRGGPPPAGLSREQTWPAPTAEDWQRPCLIPFQRTWEDALAVAKEQGKAILICVNMDGEIASEHYAGIRYRQPEIAALYEPYVCVLASVYRHTPRDHDEAGQRICCPRFGSVTCGEHIAIEPFLFERYFEGVRVAPRHIMVELDGQETYDVYYAWDTDSVFSAIKKGIADRQAPPPTVVRGDRPILERVASRDVVDRTAVEKAFADGDAALKQALLEAAKKHAASEPLDLLRQGIFGLDANQNRLAREALAGLGSESAAVLMVDALRSPLEAQEREPLIAALERIGQTSPRAKTYANVQRGLGTRSAAVDAAAWKTRLEAAEPAELVQQRYEAQAKFESSSQKLDAGVEDPQALLDLAESCVALAASPDTKRQRARLYWRDAYDQARRAEQLAGESARAHAVLALAAYYLGQREEAHERVAKAFAGEPSAAETWQGMALLALFAEARRGAIESALRERKEWPPQWLADVNTAYALLARHPLGTAQQVAQHVDFLLKLRAAGPADQALEQGLQRFPDAWDLHASLRGRVLYDRGVDGLEPEYARRLEAQASGTLAWYAAYASLVTAEYRRREKDPVRAREAYERALALYARATQLEESLRDTADHYAAMALAGEARLALEANELPSAVDLLLASFARKETAAASEDGLNISPVMTAKTLRARLQETQQQDLLAKLQAALDALDPRLLELPEWDRGGVPPGGAQRPRQRR